MTLGEIIKDARKDKKMSLKQLADECGFSSIYLESVERGDAEFYTEGTIYTIAGVLGLDGDELLISNNMIPKWMHAKIINNWYDVRKFILTR